MRGTFDRLAPHCCHDLPPGLTSPHAASVIRHLLSRNSLPRTVLSSPSLTVVKSRLKTLYFTWRTLTNITWPALPPPLKLRPYGDIDICVLLYYYYDESESPCNALWSIATLCAETIKRKFVGTLVECQVTDTFVITCYFAYHLMLLTVTMVAPWGNKGVAWRKR